MHPIRRSMVLLAGEQLWPNIRSVAHWHHEPGVLQRLFICHTGDPQRSELPARRTKKLIEQSFPGVTVMLPHKAVGIEPAAVSRQIRQWMEDYPSAEWILNATGGLKPMMAGMLRLVPDHPDSFPRIRVIYLELNGHWFEFERGADGRDLQMRPISVSDGLTDKLHVMDLVEAQANAPPGSTFTGKTPRRFDIPSLARAGVERSWDWRELLDAGNDPTETAGTLFEKYVAATILELGLKEHQVALNVAQVSSTSPSQEVDIAVNCGGRIYFIDCKLTTEEEEETGKVERLVDQIQKGSERRQTLGGRAAEYLLLRPSRDFRDDERAFARASGLEVMDRNDAFDFFTTLQKFLRLKGDAPATIREAQSILHEARASGRKTVLCCENFVVAAARENIRKNEGILNIPGLFQQMDQDWHAFTLNTNVLRMYIPKPADGSLTTPELRKWIYARLGEFGPVRVLCAKSSGNANVRLLMEKNSKRLREWLAQKTGRPFWQNEPTDRPASEPQHQSLRPRG